MNILHDMSHVLFSDHSFARHRWRAVVRRFPRSMDRLTLFEVLQEIWTRKGSNADFSQPVHVASASPWPLAQLFWVRVMKCTWDARVWGDRAKLSDVLKLARKRWSMEFHPDKNLGVPTAGEWFSAVTNVQRLVDQLLTSGDSAQQLCGMVEQGLSVFAAQAALEDARVQRDKEEYSCYLRFTGLLEDTTADYSLASVFRFAHLALDRIQTTASTSARAFLDTMRSATDAEVKAIFARDRPCGDHYRSVVETVRQHCGDLIACLVGRKDRQSAR